MSEIKHYTFPLDRYALALTPLAQQDGLKGELQILALYICEFKSGECPVMFADVTAAYGKDAAGQPQIYLYMHRWHPTTFLPMINDSASRALARTLAHEVGHWLDQQNLPGWYWQLWDWPVWQLKRRALINRRRWWRWYRLAYRWCPLERRANRYARRRWRDYHQALYGIRP